ncbi:helix-turn-helix domain-containing protein [Burkholderia plantarii]|uniref:helix-turn-helix domain-containing protein n=1 Tax=Burkholderia plantarii TaxID=41899 RepID=UPI00272D80F7|nr:helix-turn-helix domain-containing protein [Burkholderia plantarii]WLE60250.1 helix-turn-helix domain-containing protein [Burkholderia plantarii]
MATVSPFYTWRRAMMCSDLPATTKLVLFVVAEYTNGVDETAWPALETIAEKATLSIRAVTKHLSLAGELGWLTRWKSRRPDRKWAHAHYRLSIPEHAALHQRDMIDLDLAAGNVEDDMPPLALGAEDAQYVGSSEPRASSSGDVSAPGASNSGRPVEPRASDPPEPAETDESVKSYWHHVPTNYPINRDMSKPTLSHTKVVSTGSGVQREKSSEDGSLFAQWMLDRLRVDDPGCPTPDLAAWAADVDAMVRVDGHTLRQAAALVGYAMSDKFWLRVITSPARLRKNWDELRRRRNASIEKRGASPAAGSSATAGDDIRQCAHVEDGCRCIARATVLIGAGKSQRGYCRNHVAKYED